MQHNIALRAQNPRTSSVFVEAVPAIPPTQQNSSLQRLQLFWNQLRALANGLEDIVIEFPSRKHDLAQKITSPVALVEMAESRAQAKRYSHFIAALDILIIHLKSDGGTTTLRDIYYRNVLAFGGNQANSNNALQTIAGAFSLSMPLDLRILPSPKGLVWGGPNLQINTLRLEFESDYQMIPFVYDNDDERSHHNCSEHSNNSEDSDFSNKNSPNCPEVIVVMEKEAVFKSFCHYTRTLNTSTRVIALTGRGFPDTTTRQFLQMLQSQYPDVPVYVFVDSDVYGIRIFQTYLGKERRSEAQVPILAGVFLFEYTEGWLTIGKKERRLLSRCLQENTHLRTQARPNENRLQQHQTQNQNPQKHHPEHPENIPPKNYNSLQFSHPHPPPNPNLQPITQTHLQVIHRESSRALLLGIKAEMNLLANHPQASQRLNQYFWRKISPQEISPN